MASTIDLRSAIIAEAQRQGLDPSIALSVAQRESGIAQWRANGSLVTSSAGAIGIFQLMPGTAAQLGVDPRDPLQNIQGGVSYLIQMFNKYGNWNQALAAYNWGPGKLDNALSSGGASIPTQVLRYVASVLGISTIYNASQAQQADQAAYDAGAGPPPPSDNTALYVLGGITALAVIVGVF